jgi:hypothetical protein
MKSKKLLLLFVVVVVLAISGLQFRAAVAEPQDAVAAPGIYELSCLMQVSGVQEPCPAGNQLTVGTIMVLLAHVTDSAGNLAKHGTLPLIFQDCLLNGVPAPSIQCDSGSGVWSNIDRIHIMSRPTAPATDTRVGYGTPSTAQTIGFRFRYLGGTSIPNGISNSMDVTWF